MDMRGIKRKYPADGGIQSCSAKLTKTSNETHSTTLFTSRSRNISNTSPSTFSANDRLKKYRRSLEEKQNVVCKVHTLSIPCSSTQNEKPTSSNKQNAIDQRAKTEASKSTNMGNVLNRRHTLSRRDNKVTTKPEKYTIPKKSNTSPKLHCSPLTNKNFDHKQDKLPSTAGKPSITRQIEATSNINNNVEDVEMDWSPIDDTEVINNIEDLRKHYDEVAEYKTAFKENLISKLDKIPSNNTIFKDIFVVVDTNIFLSHLSTIQNILDIELNGVYKPTVLIPWMVIQELDYIKDGRSGGKSLQNNARAAVRFINENLLEKTSNLKGQSVLDANECSINSSSPDDGILACCMQILQKGNKPILLSNDVNLCNKAIINNIPAYTHDIILKELNPFGNEKDAQHTSEEIKTILSHLFSFIILDVTKKAYGEYRDSMSLLKNPPWVLDECLYRFEKLWISVFSEGMQKHFLKAVQDLRKFLKSCKVCYSVSQLNAFVELSLNCCMFLKNGFSSQYSPSVSDAINSIVNIAKKS